MSFVAIVIALAVWRFAWLTTWPRIEPTAELKPLSHMLMNGFFFNHGLAISHLHDRASGLDAKQAPGGRADRRQRELVVRTPMLRRTRLMNGCVGACMVIESSSGSGVLFNANLGHELLLPGQHLSA